MNSVGEIKPVDFLRDLARRAERTEDWQEATSLWKYILTQPDAAFWDHFSHARAVLYSGHVAEAATLISALPENNNKPAIIMLRANLEERRQKYDKATELYAEARESGASSYWSLFGQARASFQRGKIDEARELIKLALTYPESEKNGIEFAARLEPADAKATPGMLIRNSIKQNPALAKVTFDDVLSETLLRMREGEGAADGELRVALAHELQERLAEKLEVDLNRFSITNLRGKFYIFYTGIEPKPVIQGASILDLGCGSHNPLGLLFIFIMLGARQAIGVDLDKVQDPASAFRAMARSADVLQTDPKRIIYNYPITRKKIERNLAGFDLSALRAGEERGLDQSRIKLIYESASSLSLESSSIDLVISNSFLEHVDDLDTVLKEMARVTVAGGLGVHNIDGVDHWSYFASSHHPLEFLREKSTGMVNESNRIRLFEFPAIFERHGFVVEQIIPYRRIPVDDAMQESFASPWREMSREFLEVAGGVIVVRRLR